MFVSVIYRIEKAIVHQMDDYVNVFADVESGSVHEEAIAWATEVGVVKFTTAEEILTGDEDNNFNPKATIIGEDLAEMMDTYYQNELTHYVFD